MKALEVDILDEEFRPIGIVVYMTFHVLRRPLLLAARFVEQGFSMVLSRDGGQLRRGERRAPLINTGTFFVMHFQVRQGYHRGKVKRQGTGTIIPIEADPVDVPMPRGAET